MERLHITLDDEHAAKRQRLAERMHVQPGIIARSLLASAIEDADPDARNILELLDGTPGAYERAKRSLEQARTGHTDSLDELERMTFVRGGRCGCRGRSRQRAQPDTLRRGRTERPCAGGRISGPGRG